MLTHRSYDSYLSLGFGRPLSIYNEPLNDERFIQICQILPGSSTLATDMYLASQVQLARVSLFPDVSVATIRLTVFMQISRDFVFQAKCLAEMRFDPTASFGSQFGPDFSLGSMLADLNKRLDEWDHRWSWNGAVGT
jgi:hypothetical protein